MNKQERENYAVKIKKRRNIESKAKGKDPWVYEAKSAYMRGFSLPFYAALKGNYLPVDIHTTNSRSES